MNGCIFPGQDDLGSRLAQYLLGRTTETEGTAMLRGQSQKSSQPVTRDTIPKTKHQHHTTSTVKRGASAGVEAAFPWRGVGRGWNLFQRLWSSSALSTGSPVSLLQRLFRDHRVFFAVRATG